MKSYILARAQVIGRCLAWLKVSGELPKSAKCNANLFWFVREPYNLAVYSFSINNFPIWDFLFF
ncbi:MAG: hypothetical protein KAJ23_04875, partial [Maribacter sp.]|nr:hypothetical protein [Maribacter sp.]